jgi:CrcB protein
MCGGLRLRSEVGGMKLLIQCAVVGAGGFFGAVARFLLSLFCGRVFGTTFPIGTLIINLSGSLLLGWFLTTIGGRTIVPDSVRLAVAVGFVGAYTTFSTFMYESSSLLEDGSGIKAMFNLMGSLMLGLLAVRVGMWLGTR